MNILLWILRILLAFWNLVGGSYTAFHYEQLKAPWLNDSPPVLWIVISLLQILFALGLVMPGTDKRWPKLTFISAVYLVLNSLLGLALFAQYAGFPGMLWGVVPALLSAFVAYGGRVRKTS